MNRFALAAGVLALAAGLFFGAWSVLKRPKPGLPEIKAAPEFLFRNQEGVEVTRADFLGRVWIADFTFTRCTTVCPVLTSRFSEMQKSLPGHVRFVSFSVDTERDTVEVLKKHAAGLGADAKRWTFTASAGREARNELMKNFMLSAVDTPEDRENPIVHDARMVLVDARGMIRGYYDGTDAEATAKLERDARALAATGVYALPEVNASLNAASAVLLFAGLAFVRAKKYELHVAFVLGAVLVSTVFLASYLWYHAHAGATRYAGPGRGAYLALLGSHTLLAAAVPFLVAATVVKAVRRRWDTHRRWARITVPVWAYVSVTGVVIYWILFRVSL